MNIRDFDLIVFYEHNSPHSGMILSLSINSYNFVFDFFKRSRFERKGFRFDSVL